MGAGKEAQAGGREGRRRKGKEGCLSEPTTRNRAGMGEPSGVKRGLLETPRIESGRDKGKEAGSRSATLQRKRYRER